jgi:hypothetical protein
MTSPHKPLSQFHPNFTGMFLWWSPLNIVHRTLVAMATKRKKLKVSSFKEPKELELRQSIFF